MSYRIIFKGQIPEEYVGEVEGQNLSTDWEHNALPSKVKINGNLYESSSIKAVISGFANPDSQDKKEQNNEMIRKEADEHRKFIDSLLKLSPEIRAMRTGIAELLYTSLSEQKMPNELKETIVERQTEFFKKNPTWAHANPSCYKDLMPRPVHRDEYHIASSLPVAGMHLVERIVQNGIR